MYVRYMKVVLHYYRTTSEALKLFHIRPRHVPLAHVKWKHGQLVMLKSIFVLLIAVIVAVVVIPHVSPHSCDVPRKSREPSPYENMTSCAYNLVDHTQVVGIDVPEPSDLHVVV